MYNAVGGDALTNFNVRKMHILYKRCLSEVEKKNDTWPRVKESKDLIPLGVKKGQRWE